MQNIGTEFLMLAFHYVHLAGSENPKKSPKILYQCQFCEQQVSNNSFFLKIFLGKPEPLKNAKVLTKQAKKVSFYLVFSKI